MTSLAVDGLGEGDGRAGVDDDDDEEGERGSLGAWEGDGGEKSEGVGG